MDINVDDKTKQPMQNNKISATCISIAAALLIPSIAAALRLILLADLGDRAAYITFYPAVTLAALYGGFYAGAAATLVSGALADYLWIAPKHSFVISDSGDVLSMAVFILSCILISMVAEAMRRAQAHLRQRTMELAIAKDQAQEASQAKSLFLANMSHELRTPLNAIMGYTQLMQRDTNIPPKDREYIQIINRSGEHLLALINDILEMTKIESHHVVLDLVTFDLHIFIKDIEDMFRPRTQAKGLKFCVDGLDSIPSIIQADAVKLRIVMINLLGNAVKYTEKGYVVLRIALESPEILSVSVEDTGGGIAVEEMQKLFRVFEQTESGRRLGSGTGLGLAISREYVKLMGGDISVKSRVGEGSSFRFSINIKAGLQEDMLPVSVRQVIGLESGQKQYRVLIAEDTEDSRRLLETLLKMIGFEVWTVSNGAEAVSVFEAWHPHLIWMDIRMPVMDGLEATRRIRELPAGKECIIVALTAHSLNQEREYILGAGCDDFIRKPYRDKEIFECMEKHLGVRYQYGTNMPDLEPLNNGEINIEKMKELNPEKLELLYKHLLALDQKQMLSVISEIEKTDQENGLQLRLLVERLDYTQIMTLMDTMKGK